MISNANPKGIDVQLTWSEVRAIEAATRHYVTFRMHQNARKGHKERIRGRGKMIQAERINAALRFHMPELDPEKGDLATVSPE